MKPQKFSDFMRKTFFYYAIGFSIVLFLLLALIFMFTYQQSTKANKIFNADVSDFFGREMQEYRESIQTFSEDPAFAEAVLKKENLNEINQRLYSFQHNQGIKSYFVLINTDLEIVSTNLYENNKELLLKNYLIKDLSSKLNRKEILQGVHDLDFYSPQQSTFYLAGAIRSNNDVVGYLVFFLEDIGNQIRLKDVDSLIIFDQFDNVIYTTKKSFINNYGKLTIEPEKSNYLQFEGSYFYIHTGNVEENIYVTTLTSIDNFRRLGVVSIIFAIGLNAIIIFLVYIASPKLIRSTLQSFDSLTYAVQQYKLGKLDYRMETIDTYEEFKNIYEEFKKMIDQINSLIEKNNEIAERKREMEIKHLENQFNPHFVFNVLELLKYEILLEPEKAANIVVSLAYLMRYNVNYGNLEVPLDTDLSYIKDYLTLQKMRYTHRLDYTFQVDEKLLKYKIPKLLLQPIIENSIKHNINDTYHLQVEIEIKQEEENMIMIVKDDGPGIAPERLNMIRDLLDNKSGESQHIGLFHAQRIVQLLYGEEYGLEIESEVGSGTKVTIKIPLLGDDQNV